MTAALLLLSTNETAKTTTTLQSGNGEIVVVHNDDKGCNENESSMPCIIPTTTQQQQQQQQYRSVFFRYMDGKTYCLWLDPNRTTVLQVKWMLVDHVQKCNNMLFCGKNAENPRLLLSLVESKQNIDQAAQEKLTTVCSTAHYSTTTLATTTTRGMDLCMVLQGKPLEDDYVLSHYIPLLKHPQGNNNDYNATCTIVVWQRQRGGCFMVSLSIMVIIFFALISSCCTCGLSLLVVPVLLPLLFILPLFCL